MPPETDSLSPIRSLLADVGNTVLQAQASIEHGHPIELDALERMMGLLCAKALDLLPPLRQQARTELATLQEPIERLFEALADRSEA